MKRELSKDEKIQRGAKIFCGVLCISLVSGTMAYYKMEEMKAQKQVAYEIENGLNGYESIEESKNEVLESLMNEPLSDSDIAEIDKNIIKNTEERPAGYDKFGKKYTFKDNGMGEPVEKPDVKKGCMVQNPNTGVKYAINTSSWEWHISTHDQVQAEIDRQQTRVVGGESHLTEEQLNQAMKSMTINMGSMQ